MLDIGILETKSADPVDCADTAAQQDRQLRHARRYRPRRTTSDRLREAIITLTQGYADVLTHEETPWSSITFSGARHDVTLDFNGEQAVAVGEEFIAALPDHEFCIPGQLVADASIREVDHRFGADERMTVTAVLLLLEEV